MYVKEHPILGAEEEGRTVRITVDDRELWVAEGIRVNRYTSERHESRGIYCGIGQCTDCVMVVDGKPNVRTCITPVREGMVIRTQRSARAGGIADD